MAENENKNKTIEGQWIPLADASDRNIPLTNADIDDMVANYQPGREAAQLPVRFGDAKGNGPVVASVAALRRDGSKLSAKVVKVDPRFEVLYGAGKLGARTTRSMSYARTPDAGATLTGYGFKPPPIFTQAGINQQRPATDEVLNNLLSEHRAGKTLQFSASDAGRVEFIMEETMERRPAKGLADFRTSSNSGQLNELAKKIQGEQQITFGEALSKAAAQRPELTLPDRMIAFGESAAAPAPQQSDGFRFERNDEHLLRLAKERQERDDISFGEALSQIAEERPALTMPGTTMDFSEESG